MPHWFRKQYDGLHLGTQHIHNLDSTGSPQEIRVGLQVGNRPQQIVESVFIASESERPVVKPNYSPRLHAIPPVQANQV